MFCGFTLPLISFKKLLNWIKTCWILPKGISQFSFVHSQVRILGVRLDSLKILSKTQVTDTAAAAVVVVDVVEVDAAVVVVAVAVVVVVHQRKQKQMFLDPSNHPIWFLVNLKEEDKGEERGDVGKEWLDFSVSPSLSPPRQNFYLKSWPLREEDSRGGRCVRVGRGLEEGSRKEQTTLCLFASKQLMQVWVPTYLPT